MNFIGHTRYSLWKPGSSKWRATNGSRFQSEEEYREYLFSEGRLALRSEIFLNRSLPALAIASENFNFKHVVSFSSELPSRYKNQLLNAAKKYDFLLLDEQNTTDSGISVDELAESIFPKNSPYAVFRLDDDDILATNFFDLLKPYVRTEFAGMQVSMPSGFTGIIEGSRFRNIASMYSPLIALGLAGIHWKSPEGDLIAPRWVSHPKSDRANPVIMDARNPVYFRGLHLGNDTGITRDGTSAMQEAYKELGRYRPVTSVELELFESLFPTMKEGVVKYTEELLFEGLHLLEEEVKFLLPSPMQRFSIHGSFRFSEHPGKLNSLLRFELRNSNNEIVTDSQLKTVGLAYSKSPKAGYFRYIYSQAGEVLTRGDIELPEGIFCTAVTLVRWGSENTEIILERLSVQS